MRLGLATYKLPRDAPKELEPGLIQMPTNRKYSGVSVINKDTGEVVHGIAGLVWGSGKGFAGAIEAPGIFDPEHFEEGKDYVLIAFECETMQEFKGPPEDVG